MICQTESEVKVLQEHSLPIQAVLVGCMYAFLELYWSVLHHRLLRIKASTKVGK